MQTFLPYPFRGKDVTKWLQAGDFIPRMGEGVGRIRAGDRNFMPLWSASVVGEKWVKLVLSESDQSSQRSWLINSLVLALASGLR